MRTALTTLLTTFIAASAVAHDFWIEPSTFRPPAGATVGVALRVGDNFQGDPVKRNPRAIEKFILRSSRGEAPVGGSAMSEPAGSVVSDGKTSLLGFRSRPHPSSLEPLKFIAYLKEEGLERIIPRIQGARKAPVSEVFSRSAKSIIGSGAGIDVTRPLGFRFEIVPAELPAAGKPLRGRLLFDNKPVEGVLVVAIPRSDPKKKASVRSDRNGNFTLPAPTRGIWLVKAVHMVPGPQKGRVEWESLWGSLTFQVD